jgi:hypothetical protein
LFAEAASQTVRRQRVSTDVALDQYVGEIVVSGFPGLRHLPVGALRAQLDGYLLRIVHSDFREQGLNVRNTEGLVR